MKLYLSSYGVGNNPERLTKMLGDYANGLVVVNALDILSSTERLKRVKKGIGEMAALGYSCDELDLRNYFGSNESRLVEKLNSANFVWIRGGNAFILRRAMKQSGFDELISERVRNDLNFVYAGYSAGAVMAGPTIKGIDRIDDIYALPPGYREDIVWDGLNLIDFCIAPHYKSERRVYNCTDKTISYYEQQNIPFIALCDGDTVIVQDGLVEINTRRPE